MWIVAAVVALPVLVFIVIFNGLVAKRNRVENAFASIDVLLRKRYDLIPNLVATVKGYAAHERAVFEEITRLRAEALKERPRTDRAVELNNRISELLFGIMAVVEDYPELKASEGFLNLQRSLNEVEEQISAARRAYNAAVMDLNNAVQMFPSSVVAGMTGFGRRQFFEAAGAERAVPQVREGLEGAP